MKREELISFFKVLLLLIGCIFFLFLGIYTYRFGWYLSPISADWGNFGSYMSGVLGTSLTALSTVILILTLILQIRVLNNTQETVDLTKRQLESSEKAVATNRIEATFFNLIKAYSDMLTNFVFFHSTGRIAINQLHVAIYSSLDQIDKNIKNIPLNEYLKNNTTELILMQAAVNSKEVFFPETEFTKTMVALNNALQLKEALLMNRQLISLPVSIIDLLLKHKASIDYKYYLNMFTAQISITERRLLIATFAAFKSEKGNNREAEESFLEIIRFEQEKQLYAELTRYFTEVTANTELIQSVAKQ